MYVSLYKHTHTCTDTSIHTNNVFGKQNVRVNQIVTADLQEHANECNLVKYCKSAAFTGPLPQMANNKTRIPKIPTHRQYQHEHEQDQKQKQKQELQIPGAGASKHRIMEPDAR